MKTKEWINFKTYLLTFEITKNLELPYYHGSKITSLLSQIFKKHPLTDNVPSPVIPYPLEKGRLFRKGEFYPLELTVLGNDNTPLLNITNWFLSGKKDVKSGDFASFLKLEHIKDITPAYEENETTGLIHIRFLSPLRFRKKNKTKGKAFFSPDYFDPEYFLELFYNRLVLLSGFYGSALPESRRIPRCKLISMDFSWIDDRFGKTLGGIVGEVKFSMKPEKFWAKALWLGQYVHAGNNTNFGFGKYLLLNS